MGHLSKTINCNNTKTRSPKTPLEPEKEKEKTRMNKCRPAAVTAVKICIRLNVN